ncbi:MAG: hypothetical protein ABIO72_00535 [Patescibacteria group bacterium]
MESFPAQEPVLPKKETRSGLVKREQESGLNPFEPKEERPTDWKSVAERRGLYKQPASLRESFSQEALKNFGKDFYHRFFKADVVQGFKENIVGVGAIYAEASRIKNPKEMLEFARGARASGYESDAENVIRLSLERARGDDVLRAELARDAYEAGFHAYDIKTVLRDISKQDETNWFAQEGYGDVLVEDIALNEKSSAYKIEQAKASFRYLGQANERYEKAKVAILSAAKQGYRGSFDQETTERLETLEAKMASVAWIKKQLDQVLHEPSFYKIFEEDADTMFAEQQKAGLKQMDVGILDKSIFLYEQALARLDRLSSHDTVRPSRYDEIEKKQEKVQGIRDELVSSVEYHERMAERRIERLPELEDLLKSIPSKDRPLRHSSPYPIIVAISDLQRAQDLALEKIETEPKMKKRLEKINKRMYELEEMKKKYEAEIKKDL